METKIVWVLSFDAFEGGRQNVGVFASEELANLAINAEFTESGYDGSFEDFWDDYNPVIDEFQIETKL